MHEVCYFVVDPDTARGIERWRAAAQAKALDGNRIKKKYGAVQVLYNMNIAKGPGNEALLFFFRPGQERKPFELANVETVLSIEGSDEELPAYIPREGTRAHREVQRFLDRDRIIDPYAPSALEVTLGLASVEDQHLPSDIDVHEFRDGWVIEVPITRSGEDGEHIIPVYSRPEWTSISPKRFRTMMAWQEASQKGVSVTADTPPPEAEGGGRKAIVIRRGGGEPAGPT